MVDPDRCVSFFVRVENRSLLAALLRLISRRIPFLLLLELLGWHAHLVVLGCLSLSAYEAVLSQVIFIFEFFDVLLLVLSVDS